MSGQVRPWHELDTDRRTAINVTGTITEPIDSGSAISERWLNNYSIDHRFGPSKLAQKQFTFGHP